MPGPAFKRVEELFHQAVALPVAERAAFLEQACAGDGEMRAAVEGLLRHDRGGTETTPLFASPVAAAAEELRSDDSTKFAAGRRRPATAPAPLPLIAGYELLAELGRGGVGVVYRARQMGLNRIVALKMLLPESLAAPAAVARFRVEAEALARLQHPNIVPIYDIGESEGRPYFSMEYVAGGSLADWLRGRPQDSSASAALLEVLARTMHAVHQAGLIHRDLKPANILLASGGSKPSASGSGGLHPPLAECTPKITDFGLVKDQTASRDLTQIGTAMGTPRYMAPEQARSWLTPVGAAADIYALGTILYEMLTGRPPFEAESAAETIVQLLDEEPLSPRRLRPGLPRDLVTICLKCLEKAPHRRYATALHLAEDLRRFRAGEPIRARPVGPVERCYRWCRRRPLVAALLALTGLLAVAFAVTVTVYDVLLEQALKKAELHAEREREQVVQLNVNLGVVALNQEDMFTAVSYFTQALREDQGGPERNHRTRIATTLRQSGELIGQAPIKSPLVHDPALRVAFSADAHLLALAGASGDVDVEDLDTGEVRRLGGRGRGPVRQLAFQPVGRLLIAQYAGGTLSAWDLEPGKIAPPIPSSDASTFSALSDNGRWLFTVDGSHLGQVRDAVTAEPAAPPLQLTGRIERGAVSRDGRHLALIGPDGVLTVWDVRAARPLGKPIALRRAVRQVVFSPDAERLVTAGDDGTAQVWESATGALQTAWSRWGSPVAFAQFSPDGRLLVLGDRTGGARGWNTRTGRSVLLPLRHGESLAWAAFHEDGRRFITLARNGSVSFWRLPRGPELHEAVPVAPHEAAPERLPQAIRLANSTRVVVPSGPVGRLSLGEPEIGRAGHALLSPDGRRLAACDDRNTVRVWETDTGDPVTPLLWHSGVLLCGAFSPDGSRLLTGSDDRTARVWDATTGQPLAPPLRHARSIRQVFFRADGDQACVVHEDGSVSTWDLTPDTRSLEELLDLSQTLVGARGTPYR